MDRLLAVSLAVGLMLGGVPSNANAVAPAKSMTWTITFSAHGCSAHR
jgi:hypothetical protein